MANESKPSPYDALPTLPTFSLTSPELGPGDKLPDALRAESSGGEDRSPELSWSGFPEGTKSFAVTMYDPDAPTASGFWHWAVYNIPADVTSLEAFAGSADGAKLPKGAVTLHNEYRQKQYAGAAPPKGHGPHRYYFVVHSLDVAELELPEGSTPAYLGFNLFMKATGRAILQGWTETT